jgi:hypothetical protein
MAEEIINATDTEDSDLAYTRKKRIELVDGMTAKGMPSDVKEASIMLQALADMDRVSLGKKKIKSDEGISNVKALAAETIAQLFTDPRMKKLTVGTGAGVVPLLSNDILEPTIIEGELSLLPTTENFDTFMQRHQKDHL